MNKGVEERINACRQRVRLHRSAQRTRGMKSEPHPALRRELVQDKGFETTEAPLPEVGRMSSVAEILSAVSRELAWLEERAAPEVDERSPGRSGLDLKEEVGEEVGTT